MAPENNFEQIAAVNSRPNNTGPHSNSPISTRQTRNAPGQISNRVITIRPIVTIEIRTSVVTPPLAIIIMPDNSYFATAVASMVIQSTTAI